MGAVLEKKEVKVRPKRIPIPEDTDFQVVRFMNQEQKGVPLEFSAGAPISEDIRSYVLKDGLCYNLPKRLRNHVNGLKYPEYENVDDPNFPNSGQFRSMVKGYRYRFVLVPVDDSKQTVYEHLREKLNHKILPGAITNSPELHKVNIQSSDNIMSEQKQKELLTENQNVINHNVKMVETIKDKDYEIKKLRGQLKDAQGNETKGK